MGIAACITLCRWQTQVLRNAHQVRQPTLVFQNMANLRNDHFLVHG